MTTLRASMSVVMGLSTALLTTVAYADEWMDGFQRMVTESDAVLAVRITSLDTTAMAVDGPVLVRAAVLKRLKGQVGRQVQFLVPAMFASYQVGERRLVLLQRLPLSEHWVPGSPAWRSNEPIGARLCVSEDALAQLSADSLVAFVEGLRHSRIDPCADAAQP